ncbi:MAG TPA: DnaJ domain-containing protein [Rhizomicrobium sp.]
MGEILLGAVALILLILLLRAVVSANPRALMTGLRYAGAVVVAALAVGLFLTDRPAAALFVATAAWSVFTGGHVWPGGWPHFGRRSASSRGKTSTVRTPWLEMELDHDSGEMRGTVLRGALAGKRLDQLDRQELAALRAEAGSDDLESGRLLEAWLDRTFGSDWRADAHASEPPPARAATGMTRTEALKVLGLAEGAGEDDIRAAHRRLMLQNHPDRGGSDYLASKINEAKDILLGE